MCVCRVCTVGLGLQPTAEGYSHSYDYNGNGTDVPLSTELTVKVTQNSKPEPKLPNFQAKKTLLPKLGLN